MTQIEKLADDLASIERYATELEEVDTEAEILREYHNLNEYDAEYEDSIRICMEDDIDNVVETITALSNVLEETELMTKEEFETLNKVLITFMARLESMK